MIVTTGPPLVPRGVDDPQMGFLGLVRTWLVSRAVHGVLTGVGVVLGREFHAGHAEGQDVRETPGFILDSAVVPLHGIGPCGL